MEIGEMVRKARAMNDEGGTLGIFFDRPKQLCASKNSAGYGHVNCTADHSNLLRYSGICAFQRPNNSILGRFWHLQATGYRLVPLTSANNVIYTMVRY